MMMDLESHIKEVAYRDKVLKGGPQLESSRNVLFGFQGMFSTYFCILLFAVLGRLLNPSERYYGNYELSRYPSKAGHTVHIPRLTTTSSHELPSGVYPRGMRWERYIGGGMFGEVYSAFESWQEATIVICMRPSCPFQTKTSSTTNVILSSLSLPK